MPHKATTSQLYYTHFRSKDGLGVGAVLSLQCHATQAAEAVLGALTRPHVVTQTKRGRNQVVCG
jgi:hypothetical protein